MSDATLRDQLRATLLAEGVARPEDVDAIVSVALHVFEPTALAAEIDAFHAEGDLRDRMAEALDSADCPHDDYREYLDVCSKCRADALMPVVQAALTEQTQRAEQTEELLRIAHDTSNRSEAERVRAVRRAEQADDRAEAAGYEATSARLDLREAERERDEARAAVQRVRDLHRNEDGSCAACMDAHESTAASPCPTISALDQLGETT